MSRVDELTMARLELNRARGKQAECAQMKRVIDAEERAASSKVKIRA